METHYTDLRTILDDPRWRAGASEELKEYFRKPLARRSHMEIGYGEYDHEREAKGEMKQEFPVRHDNLVVLNEWLAQRTRREFWDCALPRAQD